MWYERTFRITDQQDAHKRLLLHFKGSDFETTVWVNGKEVGNHKGGYERFSFDITEQSVNGENRLSVCVKDSLDREQPRGKQRWMKENYACWYVQTTGIWKTVWLEWVPEIYLERVKMTPDLQRDSVEAEDLWFVMTRRRQVCRLRADFFHDGCRIRQNRLHGFCLSGV